MASTAIDEGSYVPLAAPGGAGRSRRGGYERGESATYQQWQDRGIQVRKSEKATTVVFWKFTNQSARVKTATKHPSQALVYC